MRRRKKKQEKYDEDNKARERKRESHFGFISIVFQFTRFSHILIQFKY